MHWQLGSVEKDSKPVAHQVFSTLTWWQDSMCMRCCSSQLVRMQKPGKQACSPGLSMRTWRGQRSTASLFAWFQIAWRGRWGQRDQAAGSRVPMCGSSFLGADSCVLGAGAGGLSGGDDRCQ